jgi:hypothetical protein
MDTQEMPLLSDCLRRKGRLQDGAAAFLFPPKTYSDMVSESVLLASYSKAIAKVNNKFILGAPAFILVFVDAKIQDGTVHFNS